MEGNDGAGPDRPAFGITRRAVIAGALAPFANIPFANIPFAGIASAGVQLPGQPVRAEGPADYGWQPAGIPPGTAIAFTDGQGRTSGLDAFAGRPVLLNIWATWCAPCILELPALDRLQKDFADRLSVIALSVDRAGLPAVTTALRRLSVRRLRPYVDRGGDAMTTLRLTGLPATIAIAADGNFLRRRRGRVDWDAPAERATLRKMMGI